MVEYWEVEGALSAFRETLLPNASLDLMVNLGPPHRVLGPDGARVWDHAWLCGLQERALSIESDLGTHLVSARLHPLGAARLLGPHAAAAANRILELEAVVGGAATTLREQLVAAASPAARFALLEAFLTGIRAPGGPAPEFLARAVARIEEAHGSLHVSRLHEALEVSRKHLAVSFTRFIGLSAKAYARILRFVWTLERLRETTEPDWPRLAAEAGYSDQSHLVRDFRRIGAASPTDYLRRRTPDGTSLLEDR